MCILDLFFCFSVVLHVAFVYCVVFHLLVLCWIEFSCCIFKLYLHIYVFVLCVLFENCGTVIFIRCVDVLFLALYIWCFARLCVYFSLSISLSVCVCVSKCAMHVFVLCMNCVCSVCTCVCVCARFLFLYDYLCLFFLLCEKIESHHTIHTNTQFTPTPTTQFTHT